MIWVKASDRLPEDNPFVVWRHIKERGAGTGFDKQFGFISPDGYEMMNSDYDNIEWLDESPEPDQVVSKKQLEEFILSYIPPRTYNEILKEYPKELHSLCTYMICQGISMVCGTHVMTAQSELRRNPDQTRLNVTELTKKRGI